MNRVLWVFVFLANVLALHAAEPRVVGELHGKVSSVTDGDTVVFRTDKQVIKVRLEGIDAPESAQEYGQASKAALSDLVIGQSVLLQKTGVDRYGRTLGTLFVNGKNISASMIESGNAWHFKRYNSETTLADLETQAKSAKRGLWDAATPIPPWEYRDQPRKPPSFVAKVPDAAVMPPATTSKKDPVPKPKQDPAPAMDAPTFSGGTTSASGKFKESASEKAYEKANGVEIVHKKNGTTYTRKARSK